jgi:hypothetical protein
MLQAPFQAASLWRTENLIAGIGAGTPVPVLLINSDYYGFTHSQTKRAVIPRYPQSNQTRRDSTPFGKPYQNNFSERDSVTGNSKRSRAVSKSWRVAANCVLGARHPKYLNV